jgi:hypothetical protein
LSSPRLRLVVTGSDSQISHVQLQRISSSRRDPSRYEKAAIWVSILQVFIQPMLNIPPKETLEALSKLYKSFRPPSLRYNALEGDIEREPIYAGNAPGW